MASLDEEAATPAASSLACAEQYQLSILMQIAGFLDAPLSEKQL